MACFLKFAVVLILVGVVCSLPAKKSKLAEETEAQLWKRLKAALEKVKGLDKKQFGSSGYSSYYSSGSSSYGGSSSGGYGSSGYGSDSGGYYSGSGGYMSGSGGYSSGSGGYYSGSGGYMSGSGGYSSGSGGYYSGSGGYSSGYDGYYSGSGGYSSGYGSSGYGSNGTGGYGSSGYNYGSSGYHTGYGSYGSSAYNGYGPYYGSGPYHGGLSDPYIRNEATNIVIEIFYRVLQEILEQPLRSHGGYHGEQECLDFQTHLSYALIHQPGDDYYGMFGKMENSLRELARRINDCSGYTPVITDEAVASLITAADIVYQMGGPERDMALGILAEAYEAEKRKALEYETYWSQQCREEIGALDCNMKTLHQEMVAVGKKK